MASPIRPNIHLTLYPRTLLVSEGSMYRILEVDIKSGETVGVFSEGGTLGAVDNIRRATGGGKAAARWWIQVLLLIPDPPSYSCLLFS